MALARQCADRIRAFYPEPATSPEFVVCNEFGDAYLIPYPFIESVYEGLRDALPQRHVIVVGMPSRANAENSPVDIAISRALSSDGNGEATGGRLIATLAFPGKSGDTFSVSYENKFWLTNLDAYQQSRPDRQFLIVRSPDICTSESQAYNLALDQATALVGLTISNNGAKDRLMRLDLCATDLQDQDMIQDQFAQSLHGESGPIWRVAILLDVSPEKLSRLVLTQTKIGIAETIETATGNHWQKMILSLLAILGTVFILYGFLQTATRGHYRRTLIVGAVILIVGGLCVIAMFA